MTHKPFGALPADIRKIARDRLTEFDQVAIWFECGQFHVITGSVIQADHAPDWEFWGYYTKADTAPTNLERAVAAFDSIKALFPDIPCEIEQRQFNNDGRDGAILIGKVPKSGTSRRPLPLTSRFSESASRASSTFRK